MTDTAVTLSENISKYQKLYQLFDRLIFYVYNDLENTLPMYLCGNAGVNLFYEEKKYTPVQILTNLNSNELAATFKGRLDMKFRIMPIFIVFLNNACDNCKCTITNEENNLYLEFGSERLLIARFYTSSDVLNYFTDTNIIQIGKFYIPTLELLKRFEELLLKLDENLTKLTHPDFNALNSCFMEYKNKMKGFKLIEGHEKTKLLEICLGKIVYGPGVNSVYPTAPDWYIEEWQNYLDKLYFGQIKINKQPYCGKYSVACEITNCYVGDVKDNNELNQYELFVFLSSYTKHSTTLNVSLDIDNTKKYIYDAIPEPDPCESFLPYQDEETQRKYEETAKKLEITLKKLYNAYTVGEIKEQITKVFAKAHEDILESVKNYAEEDEEDYYEVPPSIEPPPLKSHSLDEPNEEDEEDYYEVPPSIEPPPLESRLIEKETNKEENEKWQSGGKRIRDKRIRGKRIKGNGKRNKGKQIGGSVEDLINLQSNEFYVYSYRRFFNISEHRTCTVNDFKDKKIKINAFLSASFDPNNPAQWLYTSGEGTLIIAKVKATDIPHIIVNDFSNAYYGSESEIIFSPGLILTVEEATTKYVYFDQNDIVFPVIALVCATSYEKSYIEPSVSVSRPKVTRTGRGESPIFTTVNIGETPGFVSISQEEQSKKSKKTEHTETVQSGGLFYENIPFDRNLLLFYKGIEEIYKKNDTLNKIYERSMGSYIFTKITMPPSPQAKDFEDLILKPEREKSEQQNLLIKRVPRFTTGSTSVKTYTHPDKNEDEEVKPYENTGIKSGYVGGSKKYYNMYNQSKRMYLSLRSIQ